MSISQDRLYSIILIALRAHEALRATQSALLTIAAGLQSGSIPPAHGADLLRSLPGLVPEHSDFALLAQEEAQYRATYRDNLRRAARRRRHLAATPPPAPHDSESVPAPVQAPSEAPAAPGASAGASAEATMVPPPAGTADLDAVLSLMDDPGEAHPAARAPLPSSDNIT